MNTAYFVKVSKSMSWNELKEKINKLKNNRTKPLPFIISKIINVSSMEFDKYMTIVHNTIIEKPFIYSLSIQFHDFFKVRNVASSANLPHSGKAWFCCETSTVMKLVFLPLIYSWWAST